MSRYKPTPAQIRALRAIAARHVFRDGVRGPCKDSRTKETFSLSTMHRLLREDLVAPARYPDLYEITADGRALLAALDGAS